jgi:hypothetical protein
VLRTGFSSVELREFAGRLSRLLPVLALSLVLGGFVPASAAESGQARLGDDYAQLHIGGDDWHPCEQECTSDASCKSWTFITALGQCRLKHSVPPAIANTCCVSGVKAEASIAGKGDDADCARVANEALEADTANIRGRCGLTGPLWSSAYDDVYSHCLDSSPGRRAREADDRKQALQVCRQTADLSGKLVCDHYARMAVAENLTNTQNNCGFAGPSWSADYEQHMRYCRQAERSSVGDQIAAREHQILECLGRGGAASDPDCEAYSNQSVDQFARASRMRCGDAFSGPGWSQDAGEHYRWCRSHGRDERTAMLDRRQQALEGCGQIHIDLNKLFKF